MIDSGSRSDSDIWRHMKKLLHVWLRSMKYLQSVFIFGFTCLLNWNQWWERDMTICLEHILYREVTGEKVQSTRPCVTSLAACEKMFASFTAHLFYCSIQDLSSWLFVHVQVPFVHRHHGKNWPGFTAIGAASLNNFYDFPEMTMLYLAFELLE